MSVRTLCFLGLGLYAVLSALDFSLTHTLIEGSAGAAVESNPVAAVWLEQYGWVGLAAYKVGMVVVFLAAVGLLVPRRPRAAVGLIAVGCSALLGVTTYSQGLISAAEKEQGKYVQLVIPAPAWPTPHGPDELP